MLGSCVRLTLGSHIIKTMEMRSQICVVITFESYVRITLQKNVRIKSESYVRLTLGSYIIKPRKLDQKIT